MAMEARTRARLGFARFTLGSTAIHVTFSHRTRPQFTRDSRSVTQFFREICPESRMKRITRRKNLSILAQMVEIERFLIVEDPSSIFQISIKILGF